MKGLNELRKLIRTHIDRLLNEHDDIDDYYEKERQEYERKRLEMRRNTPMSSINEFFEGFGISMNGLKPELVKQIYINWEEYATYDDISDMENSETDDSIHVELEGVYGKHWVSFNNQQEWDNYYEKHIASEARDDFQRAYKELDLKDKASKGEFEKNTANTLGSNLSPDVLQKLKGLKETESEIEPYFEPNNGGVPVPTEKQRLHTAVYLTYVQSKSNNEFKHVSKVEFYNKLQDKLDRVTTTTSDKNYKYRVADQVDTWWSKRNERLGQVWKAEGEKGDILESYWINARFI